MIWLLAVVVGVVAGALALNYTRSKSTNELVRACGAIAGFIIGYVVVYIVARHLNV